MEVRSPIAAYCYWVCSKSKQGPEYTVFFKKTDFIRNISKKGIILNKFFYFSF